MTRVAQIDDNSIQHHTIMLRRPPTQIQLAPEDLHEYEDIKQQKIAASLSTKKMEQNTMLEDTPVNTIRTRTKGDRLGIQ